ncbi:hypothetical protein A3D00_00180 [Candidatus Woesebacteria bacterium RIFCSPHIGHO2_02_FULL_38_9]|nr:MAG: hypothetical protein A3D00_00180 [Candidatus Woesebacteria bacterium RIFCSPHIGHO2_02_FULL_38_9]OGM57437.1 MAG: hypothetical protein A3A50_05905 [Candidatus Woesebacteria bacterium RIFCSPLOWO2_01_FULL_38_20]
MVEQEGTKGALQIMQEIGKAQYRAAVKFAALQPVNDVRIKTNWGKVEATEESGRKIVDVGRGVNLVVTSSGKKHGGTWYAAPADQSSDIEPSDVFTIRPSDRPQTVTLREETPNGVRIITFPGVHITGF